MMLVKILKFGSNWWARFGHDPADSYRYTRHAAYFNSAGLRCGNKIQRHWIVPGLIRFNGVGDFNPRVPRRSVGVTFECTDLTFACGGNRLLFMRKAGPSAQPDYYLVAVSSEDCGLFEFDSRSWKSTCARPIAISRHGARQEALLLLQSGSWLRSSLGTWQLTSVEDPRRQTQLELADKPMVD